MDKWKLAGTGVLLTLSALAVAIAYHHPITARVAIAGPFATDRIADEATVTLADGRPLVLHGGTLSLGDKTFPLTTSRHFASLTTMPTGQVLIWGGVDGDGRLVETGEWFEPTTGALVTTGRLGLPVRAAHTLTVLSDGSLAMTGGWGPGNVPSHEVAIWRPLDRHLDLKPDGDTHARLGGSATLLADGTLKIAGGIDDIGRPAHDAWQYGAPDARHSATPGIAASYPLKDAAGASPIGPLALRFDEPVDVAQLNGTVSLLGPNGVVKTRVVGAENGRLAFIQLPDELYPSARYTIFVQGLHTAAGKAVPYEAIGFTTRAARNGVVLAGEGKRPGAGAAAATEPAVYVMAGEGTVKPCKPGDAFHLCRDKGEVKDGAFYPGQDNVATASGGHWRLYKDRQSLPDTRQLEANLAKGSTALIGQVRRIDETPVANVAISVDGQTVQTDARGVFVLQNLPSGRRELFVDGRPAGKPGTEYGRFVVGADVAATTINHMPFVMYLPRVLERDKIPLPSPTTRETVLTHPDMPGLELRIPAGAVFKDRDGKVLNEIAIVPTPVDHAPFPLPDNFPMYFTIQPGDAVVQGMTPDAAKGIQVVYPNYGKQKPADKADFWVYSAGKGWEMYGAGHVSKDSSQVIPDHGAALVWALGAGASVNPDDPPGGMTCGGASTQFPVDLRTGTFWHEWKDADLADTVNLSLTRSYRSDDTRPRSFGVGSTTNFGMHLYSTNGMAAISLVMPCGQDVPYRLTSGSVAWPLAGTVWTHSGSDSGLYGSTLQFLMDATSEGAHWILTTRDGSEYAFGRHTPNALAWTKDQFGNETSFVYNGGLLETISSPNGRSLTFSYDSQNRIKQLEDNIGRLTAYAYDSAGRLHSVTYPDGSTEVYGYGADGRMSRLTDRMGTVWLETTYDGSGRVTAQEFADGTKETFEYATTEQNESSTLVTLPTGRKHLYVFDANSGSVKFDIDGYGTNKPEKRTYELLASGQATSITDSIGRVITRRFDEVGNVTDITYLAGTSEAASEHYEYRRGTAELISATDPLGGVTEYSYLNGCLIGTTDALGQRTTRECDSAGRVVKIVDPAGRTTRFAYSGGDLVSVTNGRGLSTSFVWDAAGRLTSIVSPDGVVKTREYDANDRIIRQMDGSGTITEHDYDANGNLTSVRLPNGSVDRFEYDVMNRLITHIDQMGAVEAWTYYADRKPSLYSDAGGDLTYYDYDEMDRLAKTSHPDGSTTINSYDAAGRKLSQSDSSGLTVSWSYGALDQLIAEKTGNDLVEFGYDKIGQKTAVSLNGENSISYSYDKVGQVTAVSRGDRTSTFTYDGSGLRSGLLFPNGMKAFYDYDSAGNLLKLDYIHADGREIGSIRYAYGESSKRILVNSTFQAELLPEPTVGDRVYDSLNRLLSNNGHAITYDKVGRMISDSVNSFTWDAKGRLESITRPGGSSTIYKYDAAGRRASVTDSSGEQRSYLYDGQSIMAIRSSGGMSSVFPGTSVDERIGWFGGDGERFTFVDGIGSTVAETDAAGTVNRTISYDPFGVPSIDPSGTEPANRFLFTGRELDDNGIYFYRNRYYSPAIGRFLSKDPIGYSSGQLNLYSYVDGDPINRIDPFGTQSTANCLQPAAAPACAEAGMLPQGAGAASGSATTAGAGAGTADAGAVGESGGLWGRLADAIRRHPPGWSPAVPVPKPGDALCPPRPPDYEGCYDRFEKEAKRCDRWIGMGPAEAPDRWYDACVKRAEARRNLCLRGLSDEAPDEWSYRDM
ncbi:RHS repeat-associated protein [Luteibacter sp. 621]|uniref:RHS repeat domain-containing protein n=1 Tax=Luteibacter sp. 621 TaxID=3373916 RepID=UPI003D1B7C11